MEEKDGDGGTQPYTSAGGEVASPARPATNFQLKPVRLGGRPGRAPGSPGHLVRAGRRLMEWGRRYEVYQPEAGFGFTGLQIIIIKVQNIAAEPAH